MPDTEPNYAPLVVRRLPDIRARHDVTLDSPGHDDDIHIGPVAAVIGVANDYIVFLTPEGQVRYVALDSNKHHEDPGFILNWERIVRAQVNLRLLGATHDRWQLDSVRQLLGASVQSGLQGETSAMSAGLDTIELLLSDRIVNNARQIYVSTAITSGLALAALAALLALVTQTVATMIDPALEEWLLMITSGVGGGALGALLSILTSSNRDVPFDPQASNGYARFEARARTLLGVIAGVIVVACQISGLVSSSLLEGPHAIGILCAAAMAGFTERLTPSILLQRPCQVPAGSTPSN